MTNIKDAPLECFRHEVDEFEKEQSKMQKLNFSGYVFVWNESNTHVEEIIITGLDKAIMIDANTEYDIYLEEKK